MRQFFAVILTLIMLVTACCGCGLKSSSEIRFPADELLADYTFEENLEMEIVKEREGVQSVLFHRGELAIYGQIYIPEGEGPFPVVVISGGLAASHYRYQAMAQSLAENGIVGVIYDPTGILTDSGSSGKLTDYSALTQAADLEAIINTLSTLSYIDSRNVFLWGHSMGGLVSGYVGFRNPSLIRGIFLVEPAFHMNCEAAEEYPDINEIPDVIDTSPYRGFGGVYFRDLCRFDIYEYMSAYKSNVVIYAGTRSPSIGSDQPEILTRADELLPSSELIYMEGANHGFEGRFMTEITENTITFVKDNMKT